MKFKITEDASYNMLIDMLADIYSWQQIIVNQLADQVVAKGEGFSKQEVLKLWEEQKHAIRQDVIEHLYGNHGPDLSGDVGL